MGIYAEGDLVGYYVDKQNKNDKKTGLTTEYISYVYYVLLYDFKNENGLYDRVNCVKIVTDKPMPLDLKPQTVIVEMDIPNCPGSDCCLKFTKIRPKSSNA